MGKESTLEQHLRRIQPLGGKASMERRTPEERQELGRKGGIAAAKTRAKTTTKKQRSASAQNAARARWAKR